MTEEPRAITPEELKDLLVPHEITYKEYKQVLGEISEEQNERLCKS